MWKLSEGQALTYRGWDDEYVVYNDVSGDTHLLGVDALQLLLRLRTGPADEDDLARVLQIEAGEREVLAVTLVELGALFLIERI
jgi:PqqD family protein of HPr-rel-A system